MCGPFDDPTQHDRWDVPNPLRLRSVEDEELDAMRERALARWDSAPETAVKAEEVAQ
jgi:hypothetical protein